MHTPSVPARGPSGAARRAFVLIAALTLALGLAPFAPMAAPAAAQETGACDVQFHSTVSEAGFTHPGIGLTEPVLANVRDQIAAGAEPWTSSFEALKHSYAAADNVTSSNRSGTDPSKPASDAFNSQGFNSRFIADGLKAYTQSVMYVLTGEEVYRKNALDIIRIWEQMDPAKYVYFTDSHIHTGIPLNRMLTAAELLRYTSCGEGEAHPWTDEDTRLLTENLIEPSIATFMSSPDHFMNQHNYPLLGSMAGAIFMDDKALYDEKVEWFTVNATAKDQGFNGSIARLFRWVDTNDATGEPIDDPHVQHVEMGRDQAHGGGDITNATILARMMIGQGTKVDPVEGTVSTADDAVGPYEFLGDRILAAADYFWQFMLGYDTEWTPVAYAISPDGTIRDTYNHISNSYRGRYVTASFWEIYYHYAFERGEDVEAIAPYFAEAYAKRPGPLFYYGGNVNDAWNVGDGGGDSWLFAPAEAAGEAVPALPASGTILEVEDRYTHLAGDVETIADGDTGYVRMSAAAEGAKIAYLNGSTSKNLIGFRVRTDGRAVLKLDSRNVIVPDTGGAWRYVMLDRAIGDILFIEATGATVDVDHINTNAAVELTPPSFAADAPDRVIAWDGATATADLAAVDTGGDPIAYSVTGLPEGAELDAATGELTWTPTGEAAATVTITATDGTVVVSRRLALDAAADRAGALALTEDAYDPDALYVKATEEAFTAAHDAAEALRKRGTDTEFGAALAELRAATTALQLVSPRSALDGSLDYPGLEASSTAGTSIWNWVDGNNQTGTWYGQAQNLSHTIDFGPDFKVSASKFGFQSNIFADRLANSAVFGSNDGTEWTRLTPGTTAFTQEFNTLDVDPELQDDQFRYIKVQMLEPQPDVLYGIVRNLFEVNEFHIWGDRHEIGNLIAASSIASDQAVAGKVAVGDTVDVTVTAREPLASLTATASGNVVEASSEDGLTWTASVPLDGAEPGPVTLEIGYTDANGRPGPTFYGTTDGTALFLGGDRDHRVDVTALATVTASDKQWPGNGLSAEEVGYLLFDGDGTTAGDLNTGSGSYYTLDFGEGASVRLDEVYFLPRACCATRANGTIVQGSDDGQSWTDLTEVLTGAAQGKWLQRDAAGDQHFRHFRIYNAGAWNGNLAEVEFYGDFTYDDAYFESRVRDSSTATRASAYTYEEEVARIRAALAEEGADRTALLNQLLAAADLLVPQTSLFPEVEPDAAGVTASSVSWDGKADAAANGWRAFDGDATTSPDTTSASGWVRVDLGEGGEVALAGVNYLPRTGNHLRMNGAQIQGSNDGTTWDALATISGVTKAEWGSVAIESGTAYRYLRYSTSTGFANVAELVFVERTVDRTLVDLLLGRAELLDEADWTAHSWTALAAAVATGEDLADDAGQAEVDAAAEAIDAAIDGLVWNVPEWDETTRYTAGARVAYEGDVYVAQWWTRGQVPGESPYSAWAEVGTALYCGGDRLTEWTASAIYEEGAEAVHDGKRWRAEWWTRNQEPGMAGVWEEVGAC
ncbi:discoidin domain-containing protein [Glycomyces sp. YM15]|uniref:galactose-binding domain-containing protein n=1 Tax=Glycomyces sp. YM15 TaxID=2800446 RepID=UPI0019664A9D|nr:discoidin domain-containing protein [Glycomyces sp. YM15]